MFYQEGTASSIDSSSNSQGRDVGATGVFDPHLNGEKLTFQRKDDAFVDDETGSTWNLFGRAISGRLAGKKLTPIVHWGSQLWFSWAVFKPDTVVYRGK